MMTDVVSQFVAWSDNANEYADDKREALKQRALEDIDALLMDPSVRDGELWDALDVGDETVEDFDAVDTDARDLDWVLGFGGVASAAGVQFFLDNRDDLIIEPAAYRAQVLASFELTRQQLISAGKREVQKFSIEQYQSLQSRVVREFQFLKEISNTQLYRGLQSIGALKDFDKYVADATGYVSRMTSYPPGSPQFKEAVADITNMQATGAQRRMNRRSIEALSVERQTGGDETVLMCWVLDPTSAHCSYCPQRAGEIMTLGEWRNYGLPGADVCRGGDNCNCHLYEV
jgi:hypothetical protein